MLNIVGHNYNTICNKIILLLKQKMAFSETVPINVLSQIVSPEVYDDCLYSSTFRLQFGKVFITYIFIYYKCVIY